MLDDWRFLVEAVRSLREASEGELILRVIQVGERCFEGVRNLHLLVK